MAIVFVRVDDRLIHGQITTAWIADAKASRIVISSDEVAGDSLQKTIINVTKPPRINVDVLNSEETIQREKSGAWSREKIFLICKYPSDALQLVRAELGIKEINVGNVGGMSQHKAGTRKQIFKSIAVTEDDVSVFQEILAAGVGIEIRVTPRDRQVDMATLLDKV